MVVGSLPLSISVSFAGAPAALTRTPAALAWAPLSQSLAGHDLLLEWRAGIEIVALGALGGLRGRTPLEGLRGGWREVLWRRWHLVGFGSEDFERSAGSC